MATFEHSVIFSFSSSLHLLFSLLTAPHKLKNHKRATFEVVGCFAKCDDCVLNFPELLFIDTGETENYGDSLLEYTRQFVNRCAQRSQLRGFEYFGIANYGAVYIYIYSYRVYIKS